VIKAPLGALAARLQDIGKYYNIIK
jgi:hypothetical protein